MARTYAAFREYRLPTFRANQELLSLDEKRSRRDAILNSLNACELSKVNEVNAPAVEACQHLGGCQRAELHLSLLGVGILAGQRLGDVAWMDHELRRA